MDADSSYGGSDTAQDYHSAHENNSSFETSHNSASHNNDGDKVTNIFVSSTQSQPEEINNQFYHINEVTLPINDNENGYQSDESISKPREPHYLSTAKLNINETLEHHSNLEEMNKQYKSTSQLNSESPRSMRSNAGAGIDNMVFEGDVPDQMNVKSTFNSTKPYNGELHPSLALGMNSTNHNEEAMTEAVNLELINLKPTGKDVTGHYENVGNGMTTIPLKRENDTEVGNPYDEYFVPVNEHRKYMRGEKLYVTMDKRGKKGKSKCLCWGICLCIVAAALIIGILAAVGVIGNQEPIQEANARNFDGTEPEIKKGSLYSSGTVRNNKPPKLDPPKSEPPTTTIYNTLPPTEIPKIQVGVTEIQRSSEEVKGRRLDETEPKIYEDSLFTSTKVFNTEPPTPFTPAPSISTVSNIPPSTDMSMIRVPRALDSEIVIDNIQFTPALADKNSSEFNTLSTELRKELKELLFSKDVLQYGPADIRIRVKEFVPERAGRVTVNYRIAWVFKNGIHNVKDPIDEVKLEKKMSQFLEQTSGLIGPYHMPKMVVRAERILDLCKIDNNGCEHICLFDYDILDFTCICTHGKILSNDKKACIEKPEYGSDSNAGPISNFNQEDHYSKYEPNFESQTTTQPSTFTDSEVNRKSKYNIYSIPQTETTIGPEPVTLISSNDKEVLRDTEQYVTEPISGLSGERTTDTAANSNSESQSSDSEKINDYLNSAVPTEDFLERENLTNVHFTTTESDMVHHITMEITTVVNDVERNQNSEQLTSSPVETNVSTNVERTSVSILESLVEGTTEISVKHTTEPIDETTPEITSMKFTEENQDHIKENLFVQRKTKPSENDTNSGGNEIITMPDITTYPNVLPEHKMHELGVVNLVTPEAEIYTTTFSPTLLPEDVDDNKIRKTLNEESKTVQPLINSNNEVSTKKSQSFMEITTQLLSQTGDNELHFIPVIINEDEEINKTERAPISIYVSTEVPSSYTKSAPLNVSEHYEISSQGPKIYEITNQQVVSEVKLNMENSTEKISDHMNILEHPENSLSDYMSPFLPEIENDTFANTLHSDDHFNDNLFISKHVDSQENITEYKTNPPNLENDQLNHTNPIDLQQNDTYLSVVPLQPESKENVPEEQNQAQGDILTLHKEINNPDNSTELNIENITNDEDLLKLKENNLETTTISKEYYNKQVAAKLAAKVNSSIDIEPTTSSVTETTLESFETTHMEREEVTTETAKEKDVITALPPEIINNVHSNNYFEKNSKMLEEQTILLNDEITKKQKLTTQPLTEITTTQLPLDTRTEYAKITIDNETTMRDDSSTEDLITSETTTNSLNTSDESQTQAITSKSNYLIENSTINDDIVETATKFVNFLTTEENDMLTEELTTSAPQSSPLTSQSPLLDPISHYEVKETVADITTTEKLFLSIKPATNIIAVINQEDNEDLSIIPLEKETVDNAKLDKKRLASQDSFNQLELLDNNSFNSISNEDHNLDTFPETFDTKYVGSTRNENATNSDYDDKSSRGLKNGKQKLDKYNKAIFNKTIKQDILVLKDDNENLNTLKQDEKVNTNLFDTVKPVTEDFTLPRFTRCVINQFPCLNGTYIKDGSYCIPNNDRCDSVYDCSDGSDEVNCTEEGCPNNFQCSSGQCLKRYLVCDGIINCNDGSDEVNCEKWSCNVDEISCGPGSRCIPISWKCDGRSHCSDGSDEHHCHQYTCSNGAFHCTEQDTCIPLSWKCDGKSDCANGDDEKFCECTKEQFKCEIGGGCINMEEVCDGIEQCADKSDEWNCLRIEELGNNSEETSRKNILQVRNMNNTWYPVCMDWTNWNTTYADKICQSMGFAGATLLESVPKPKGNQTDNYYKLVTTSQSIYGQSILSQLEKTEHNSCDQLVSITCQEFVCGNNASTDVFSDQIDVDSNNTLPTHLPNLGLLYDTKHNMYCTATILTPLWAIASYSCMVAVTRSVVTSEWTLSAGSTNFNQIDNTTAQTREIKQIIPHPQAKFSRFEFTNDVVLIQLSQPLILNGNISTVCLASNETVPEQSCVTAGWGVSQPGEYSKRQYVHHILGSTINAQECNSTKNYKGMITEDKVCAVYNKENIPCYNNEGAPLICFSNTTGTWELQGIQSHQENCNGSTHPTIYSAVNLHLKNWIINTIGKKALIRNL